MVISELCIYPIKSMGGISLPEIKVEKRGFQYDRRWMLIEPTGQFITQRTDPIMALLRPEIHDTGLIIKQKGSIRYSPLIPFDESKYPSTKNVTVWNDEVQALIADASINAWLTDVLGRPCELAYLPLSSQRPIRPDYAKAGEEVSFADGFPYLILGEESHNLLNQKLERPVPINRFRANIIFKGGNPHDEDLFQYFNIGEVPFRATKTCARCPVPNIDQDTAESNKAVTKALVAYRRESNKVYFGMNACWEGNGHESIRVGDTITLL